MFLHCDHDDRESYGGWVARMRWRHKALAFRVSRALPGGEHLHYASAAASLEDLLLRYGIEYRAPCDARAMDLANRSIATVASTNTLEHIPPRTSAPSCTSVIAYAAPMPC